MKGEAEGPLLSTELLALTNKASQSTCPSIRVEQSTFSVLEEADTFLCSPLPIPPFRSVLRGLVYKFRIVDQALDDVACQEDTQSNDRSSRGVSARARGRTSISRSGAIGRPFLRAGYPERTCASVRLPKRNASWSFVRCTRLLQLHLASTGLSWDCF